MSNWSTSWEKRMPSAIAGDPVTFVYVCTSQRSWLVRVSLRELAAVLIEAADRLSEPTGGE